MHTHNDLNIVEKMWTSDGSADPASVPTAGGETLDSDRERGWGCWKELQMSGRDHSAPSSDPTVTINTSPLPPTGIRQSPSSNHELSCTTSYQVELEPKQLLSSDFITSKIEPRNASIPTGTLQHHLSPLLSPYFALDSSSSTAESEVVSKLDHSLSASKMTLEFQENQFTNLAASSSSSALIPFEVGRNLERGLPGEECYTTDFVEAENHYYQKTIDAQEFDMDLDYDIYDDMIFTNEGSEELFDDRLDNSQETESPPSEDLKAEEAPSWYRNQVSSTGNNTPPSTICPDFQLLLSTVHEAWKEIETEGTVQKGSIVGQIQELAYVRERDEFHFDRPHQVDITAGFGDKIAALLEGETSTPRLNVKLNVDLQRALAVSQGSETFHEDFKALYKFTEASSMRGCFIPPTALKAVSEQEAKRSELLLRGSAAQLIPKEELVEFDSTQAMPVHVQVLQVKQEKDSECNLDLSSKDIRSYQKVRNLLRRLEQSWVTHTKHVLRGSARDTIRYDLTHLTIAAGFKRDGLWLNERKRPIGHCPGVPVGACFNYRIEMVIIGLHRTCQDGIAVVPADFSPYGKPVATSVVLLTKHLHYKDDRDLGDKVIYSGQGGFSRQTNGYKDQKLLKGNLALANSFELGVPIRLIRGHSHQNGRTGRLYSYDGLYKVTDVNYETGIHGNKVYLFTMVRLPGQGPLPVPSKDALMYEGEDDTDIYLGQVRERNRKFRKFRAPVLKIKSSTAPRSKDKLFAAATTPGLFRSPTKTEFTSLEIKDALDEAFRSVPHSRCASSTQQFSPGPPEWVSVEISSTQKRTSARAPSTIRFTNHDGPHQHCKKGLNDL